MGKRVNSEAAGIVGEGEPLPTGWCWATVAEIGRVQLGRQRSPDNHRGTHMRPYLRVANVFEDRIDIGDVMEMNFTPAEFETFKLEHGDVLLNEGQSLELVGRPAMYRGELPGACFTNSLVRFRGASFVSQSWALQLFRWMMHSGQFRAIAKITTNIAHLGAGRFGELRVPLPPLAEQRRIVAKLEALLGRIRRAREALDAVPAMVERYKKSVLGVAFACVTAPASPLGEICSAVTSGSRGWSEHYATSGATFVRVGNFGRNQVELDLSSIAFVDPPRDAEGTRTGLKPGDVLITITADVGKTAVVRSSLGEAYVNQHVALCRPTHRVDSDYLAWCLLDPAGIQKTIREIEYGMTKASLSLRQLRDLQIPLPPLDEQRAIVARIDAAFARACSMLAAAESARAQLDTLERSLLAKAFRGELVEQDPADEPASVMLDRVRAERAKADAPAKKPRKPRGESAPSAPTEEPERVAPPPTAARRPKPVPDSLAAARAGRAATATHAVQSAYAKPSHRKR